MDQPIKRHGGKHYLAQWHHSLAAPHTHSVDVFFGGGSYTLTKPFEGISEVVNDLDLELTNFWRVLQSPSIFDRFVREVQAVPFSQYEWENAVYPEEVSPEMMPCVPAAVCFFIRNRMSRQGLEKSFATLSKSRVRRGMNEQVASWLTAVEGLPEVHARLQRLVIRHDDFRDIIRSEDSPHTLFYCDPPYLHETRSVKDAYKHEMSYQDHEDLLALLSGIEGKFMLCGYPSDLYSSWATSLGWRCESRNIDNKASAAEVKPRKEECVWLNYVTAG